MARVITHHSCITIQRPPDDVAAYVLDPTTMPHWSAVIYEVNPPAEDVFRPGGRLRGRMHILGLSLVVEGEMLEFDPPGRRAAIVVRPVGAPDVDDCQLEHELWVEDLGDASVLHFLNRLTLPDWLPADLAGNNLVRHLFDQTAAFALANIRFILENRLEVAVGSFGEAVTRVLSGS